MGVFGLAHPLLSLFYNYVFFIRKLYNFKFYIKRIFDCILATGFKHMFFSISCNCSLENDFCVKDRKLGQKKLKSSEEV